MRFVMSQKWWSWTDDFHVKDESGKNVYQVDGKAFSFGNQLSFQDLNGNRLAYIKQKLLSWGPTYEIYQGDALLAEVRKHLFTFFRYKFTIDVPGPNDLEAVGDFFNREYSFSRGGNVVATVTKKMLSWTDTYGIEVEREEDSILILASAVVIDLICQDEKKN